ncbi:pseudouridine synthase [Nocardiopsis alba]|uniref:pseudouridine synthase n=1 Tax=Nocardiopsis alba TaxID=53437 RepID=UPI0033FF633E
MSTTDNDRPRGERGGYAPRGERGDYDDRGGRGRRSFDRDDRRGGGRPDRDRGGFRGDRDRRDDRGGRSYDRRDDRGGRSFERRDDRRGGGGRFDRDERPRRDDRDRGGFRGDRDRRDDRGGRSFERRDDRRGGFQGRRDDRDRGGRSFDRDDRGGRSFERRDDRRGGGGRFDRDERPRRDDRDRGGFRGDRDRRDDRGGRSYDRRDDRGGRSFERRDDRRGGGGRFDRDERPRRDDRDRGGRSFDRDDRGGRSHDRRDDRRGGGRPQDRRDDRRGGGGRFDRDERPRRDDRRSSGRDDRRDRYQGRRDQAPTGGAVKSENQLSKAARERLNALRADYDPRDEDRHSGEDRDTYTDVPDGIRLQKALAAAGVASRRASEEMIAAGRVSVDGQIVRRFGARVDPEASEIRVDGMRVVTAPDKLYFALNKPRGVVSTMWDPQGRPTLADYTGQTEERIFHVGRLDTETEGLILLTNDGELANRLTHPRYKVIKTYIAKVPGPVPHRVVREIEKGIELEDGPVEVDSFRVVDNDSQQAMVEIRLHEGRKHIVRRLMEEVGHPVTDLARTQVGPIDLNTLRLGTMRALSSREIGELYKVAGL